MLLRKHFLIVTDTMGWLLSSVFFPDSLCDRLCLLTSPCVSSELLLCSPRLLFGPQFCFASSILKIKLWILDAISWLKPAFCPFAFLPLCVLQLFACSKCQCGFSSQVKVWRCDQSSVKIRPVIIALMLKDRASENWLMNNLNCNLTERMERCWVGSCLRSFNALKDRIMTQCAHHCDTTCHNSLYNSCCDNIFNLTKMTGQCLGPGQRGVEGK